MESRTRIIVIENDASLCDVLSDFFELTGYDYRIYNDSIDLFEKVKEFNPQLILLDYLLPTTNGGECCIELKASACTKHIPVIIYSAIANTSFPETKFGCDLFIEKPFDLDYLLTSIERLTVSESISG